MTAKMQAYKVQTVLIIQECGGDGTPDTTDSAPNDPCVDYTIGSRVITGSLWASADCDGDGVTNGAESTATIGPTITHINHL
ncbi:MAG: hypothetical protein IPO48_21145 [Saprospiraceae bacterium]|nr:hypothetical protein [Saprospiraceae bacterium]